MFHFCSTLQLLCTTNVVRMRELLDSNEYMFRFEVDASAKLGLEDCIEGLNVLGVHELMKLNLTSL